MAKKATTKKAAPKKAAGKSKPKGVWSTPKTVKKAKATQPRKTLVKFADKYATVREVKPKTPSETKKKMIGAYEHGKDVGKQLQKLEQKIRESQMQAGPKVTARVSFELDEANNCKINVSGDFNVILQKMHEIQNQSITIDKGEFFAVAAKMMKGEQK
jgi:hypothetical protein